MKEKISTTLDFLRNDIWMLPVKELSRTKAFIVRTLKVFLMTIRGFQDDHCSVKASALTFYSLLSVVPIIAMIFGIAKGFGFDKRLQLQLLEKFSGQEDVLLKVFEFSGSLLQKTRGGIVAGIGVALLFWSVINVLGYVERSFNDIWKVEKPRSFGRKSSDYLSVVLVCPLLFIMASSLTVTMAGKVKYVAEIVSRLGVPPGPILLLLDIIPFVLIWALFSFIYIYMPNTKVHFRSGLIAAVVSGTAYQAFQWIYIAFQVGVSRANAIYGSFAALPLFLVWLQISWMIVLFGSELSHAVQNVHTYGGPADPEKVSPYNRKLISLLIARVVIRKFSEGEKPLTAPGIADVLGMPAHLIRQILSDLSAGGLFSTTEREEYEETAYQPARDIHKITVTTVLDALERSGSVDPVFSPTEDFRAVSATLETFGTTIDTSPANKLVMDL
ncbi:MAG TPA: YihY/virulence factor BrkB family protein [Candidatus Limnocylindria bacterium]|nr:YihY/virulence factor BrkB family protein [Candidatus Limnocylindria bacterium]